jgi:methylenetetrahydrofolate reductase (NADPH)
LHLGVPGVIDRTKLLTMGMRLGIGSSMRYVKKNKGVLGRLFSPGGYDPTKLITPLSKQARELNIEGLHLFTFNNVEATAEWQRKQLAKLG